MNQAVAYLEPEKKQPLYRQIADTIREDILNGNIGVNDRLLPEGKLATSFNVGLVTAQKALKILNAENLIERNPQGTFVSQAALQMLKVKNIGLLMFGLGQELTMRQSPIHYRLFDGIQKFCFEHAWHLQIIHTKYDAFSWSHLMQLNVSGLLLVFPKKADYALITELSKRKIPFVCINLFDEEINQNINFLNLNYYDAAIDAVHNLYKSGKKNIAVVSPHKVSPASHQYHIINGYKDAVKRLGLKENVIYTEESEDFHGQELQLFKKYDGFIAVVPEHAISLLKAGKEANLAIPQIGASLITFFENQETRKAGITSYKPDMTVLGYESICLLDKIFNDKDKKLQQQKVALQLMEYTSA